MFEFSISSKNKLATCHPDLQKLLKEVIKYYNCIIVCGSRSDFDQIKAFKDGNSKLDGVKNKSKHQVNKEFPYSRAIDVIPNPIDWNDKNRFYHFAGYVKGIAQMMNIKIKWGGDWDSDNDFKDQIFFDLPHFELID